MTYILTWAALASWRGAAGFIRGLKGGSYRVILLLLFLFSAYRFEVGCDWGGYMGHFFAQSYSSLGEALSKREPLYWALVEGVHGLGLSYPWVNVATSAIFFAGVHVLARRQRDPLGFLVLLFPILIINMPMSGIRQGAAIGLMCIAFCAFIDRRVIWFTLWTVIAAGFHNSALIFLLLIPLVGGEYTRRRLALAALLAIPGGLALVMGSSGEVAASRYIGTGIDAQGAAFRVGVLTLSALAFFLLLRKPWKQAFPEDYKLVSIAGLIMLALIVLLPVSTVIADRLAYYMVPLQALIFARIPYLPIRKVRSLYAIAPYLGLTLVFLVWTALSAHFHYCYLPYQTWIFGFPTPTRGIFF